MQQNKNSMALRLFALILGLFIDAYGNSLTIVTNNGNGIWTAVAVDFNLLFGFSIAWTTFAFGIMNIVLNQFLVQRLDWWRISSGIVYMIFFSYFIDLFNDLNLWLGVQSVHPIAGFLLSIIGLLCMGIAISMYQRANILMHPNDDTTNILRFKYFGGSAIKSQFADMGVIAIIIAICSAVLGHIDAIGIITVLSFFCLGPIIKYSDILVLPSLKHNFSANDNI